MPGLTWFGRVYVLEAMTRLDETKARVMSIFGDILKMDSTKKVRFLSPCAVASYDVCVPSVRVSKRVFVSCRSPKSSRAPPPGLPPG